MQRRGVANPLQQPTLTGKEPRRNGEGKAERSEPLCLALSMRLGYATRKEGCQKVDERSESPQICVSLNGGDTLHNLGNAHQGLGEYNKAIKYYKHSLAIKKRIYGNHPHQDVVDSLMSLCSAYQNLGQFPKAMECYLSLFAMQTQPLQRRNDYWPPPSPWT